MTTRRREPFPWDAAGWAVVVLVGLANLLSWDWSALLSGVLVALGSYQLGRP